MSPLKETIVSDAYCGLDVAKRSAAVKASIKLYEIGELGKNLMPKRAEDAIQCKHLFPHMKKEEHSDAQPGTNSKKRRHPLVVSTAKAKMFT